MSIALVRAVLDSALERRFRLLALVLATYADQDGGRVFPSVDRLAREVSGLAGPTSEPARGSRPGRHPYRRRVQRDLRALETSGILERESDARGGARRTVRYRFRAEALPIRDGTAAGRAPFNGGTETALIDEGAKATAVEETARAVELTGTAVDPTPNGGPAAARSVRDPSSDPSEDPSDARAHKNGGRETRPGTTRRQRPNGPTALAAIMEGVRETNPDLARAWDRDRRRRQSA